MRNAASPRLGVARSGAWTSQVRQLGRRFVIGLDLHCNGKRIMLSRHLAEVLSANRIGLTICQPSEPLRFLAIEGRRHAP